MKTEPQVPPVPLAADREAEMNTVLREAALDSLVTFSETCETGYRAARFHRLLAGKLESCFNRKIRRLCISCAPRHGKSLTTSVLFPAWAMTKDPALNIIQAGYSAELAEGFSRQTKGVLCSERYRELFPPIISPAMNRQKFWQTRRGGGYFATGVGGGAVGRGADLFIVDDATKNREEANSPANRDRIWNWFISTAMTRLSPSGVMIVIATRWHEDDLIGRLTNPERLREMREAGCGDEAFETLSLEALCEHPETDSLRRPLGGPLWPEVWPASRLEGMKVQLGPHEFAAQYQQRPAPAGGNLVDYRKIQLIDRQQLLPDLKLVRAWDLAFSTKEQADFSCGALGAMDSAGNLYLVHMNRGKRAWPDQKRVIVQCALEEAVGGKIGIETVGAWKLAEEELRTALGGRVIVKGYTPDKDKVGRANPWLAKIDAGMFFVCRGPWVQDFMHELEQFPNGSHDDQVDAVTVLWEMVRKRDVFLFA